MRYDPPTIVAKGTTDELGKSRLHPTATKLFAVFTVASLMVTILLLYFPMLFVNAKMAMQGSDYSNHLRFAQQIHETQTITLPHFLYHFLVILIRSVLSSHDWVIAGYYITPLLCYLFTGSALYAVIVKSLGAVDSALKALTAFVLTLSFMIAAPINLFTYPHLYFGYLPIVMNTYHNPTVLLAKPLCLLAFDRTLAVLQLKQTKWPLALSILTALTLLAKPSYLICLIPALLLLLIYRYFCKQPTNWLPLTTGVFLPALLILAWQCALAFGPEHAVGLPYHRSITFAPFAIANFYAHCNVPNVIWQPLLSLLFPALVYLICLPESRKDLSLNLCWLTFLISLAYYFFLAELECGKIDLSANFAWGSQLSFFMLFVYSTLFLLNSLRFDPLRYRMKRQPLALAGCFLAWLLHIVSGVLFYLQNLTLRTHFLS